MREAWPILEPSTPLRWGWHLDAICHRLEQVANGEIRHLIINIPPGCAKSLLAAVFYPAWRWLRDPGWRVLCASYALELSTRDSVRCRQLIESDWYQSMVEWELEPDQNRKTAFQNTERGFRYALSVAGAATGLRGSGTILDDSNRADDAGNTDSLDKAWEWYRTVFWTRINDQTKAERIVIMQRLHDRDVVGQLLRTQGEDWTLLCLPMRFDPDRADPLDQRTEKGELLLPALFPEAEVTRLEKTLGPTAAAAQLQQLPVPADGGIFKIEHLRFWYDPNLPQPEPLTWPGSEVPVPQAALPRIEGCVQSWDLSFKGTKDSDFAVGQTWGLADSSAYLLEQRRGQWGFARSKDEVLGMYTESSHTVEGLYVEDAANGPAVIDSLRHTIPGLVPVKPEGGKEARAWAAEPQFAAGQVWLPHPHQQPWVMEYVRELLAFPRGLHDDQVDATTQALAQIKKRVVILI